MSINTEELKSSLIGRILLVNITKRSYNGMTFVEYELADPGFVSDMEQMGYPNFRLHFPGTMSTADFVQGRLNLTIERDGRIAEVFFG